MIVETGSVFFFRLRRRNGTTVAELGETPRVRRGVLWRESEGGACQGGRRVGRLWPNMWDIGSLMLGRVDTAASPGGVECRRVQLKWVGPRVTVVGGTVWHAEI